MADHELTSASVDPVPASQDSAPDSRGDHEASDQDPNAQVESDIVQDDVQVGPMLDGVAKDAGGDLHGLTQEDVFTEPAPASLTEESKKVDAVPGKRINPASKDKAAGPAKSASGKVIPSTPKDKKVCWPCFVGTLASLLTMCWPGFESSHVGCWQC